MKYAQLKMLVSMEVALIAVKRIKLLISYPLLIPSKPAQKEFAEIKLENYIIYNPLFLQL